jgi:hypothetical protein
LRFVVRARCCAAALLISAAMLSGTAFAQTPGEWKYTIATDPASVPVDMRVNFPTVSFKACLRAADFESGRAFGLQTLASSQTRCPTNDFVRERMAGGKSDGVKFTFSCDQGQTLSGKGEGRVAAKRFDLRLDSTYSPPVSGVETIKQTMNAVYAGACAASLDSDLLEVKPN